MENGIPAFDVLLEGAKGLADVIVSHLDSCLREDRAEITGSVN